MDKQLALEELIRRLLTQVDPNPTRGGLSETPKRAAKAWLDWTSGYDKNPADILKVFEDGAEKYNQMVVRNGIPVYSHCEHHLAPIIGVCHIAYIPYKKIVGLSKLDRLVDIFSRRLQVQERMTDQIADALEDNLEAIGIGVLIKARHLCIESRGVQHQNSTTITTALRGVLLTEPATRQEFLRTAV